MPWPKHRQAIGTNAHAKGRGEEPIQPERPRNNELTERRPSRLPALPDASVADLWLVAGDHEGRRGQVHRLDDKKARFFALAAVPANG